MAGGLGFGEGVVSATAGHEARIATDQPPRQSTRGNRGVPPTRFIEMYLAGIAAAAEEEVKQSPSEVIVQQERHCRALTTPSGKRLWMLKWRA